MGIHRSLVTGSRHGVRGLAEYPTRLARAIPGLRSTPRRPSPSPHLVRDYPSSRGILPRPGACGDTASHATAPRASDPPGQGKRQGPRAHPCPIDAHVSTSYTVNGTQFSTISSVRGRGIAAGTASPGFIPTNSAIGSGSGAGLQRRSWYSWWVVEGFRIVARARA